MNIPSDRREKTQRRFLLLVLVGISVLFVWMVRDFVMTLLVAAILSGMIHPLFRRLTTWFRGRQALASVTTVLAVLLLIIAPLSAFLGVVAAEAIDVSRTISPRVREFLTEPTAFDRLIDSVPFMDVLDPYKNELLTRLGVAVEKIGEFFFDSVAAATAGTALFFFHLFIMLYAMFFFVIYGKTVLDRIMYYAPMPREMQSRMIQKFVSVSRATMKGTLVIGVVQGGLAGLAFAVVGIQGATFWGTIMAVLSIIPAVGTGLVWVPAVVWLLATGKTAAGLGLLAWCAIVVGTADNFLRPRLVGRDTEMPDLLVLLGTLGGITLFGAIGIMIGPVVAALFITIWELYGEAYKEVLAE
jgi:predicted PurR-regulated permease PerM